MNCPIRIQNFGAALAIIFFAMALPIGFSKAAQWWDKGFQLKKYDELSQSFIHHSLFYLEDFHSPFVFPYEKYRAVIIGKEGTIQLYNVKSKKTENSLRISQNRVVVSTATPLLNQSILITGTIGSIKESKPFSKQYNPKSNFLSDTGHMHIPRSDASATLLKNGHVLIAGGSAFNTSPSVISKGTLEEYIPTTNQYRVLPTEITPRFSHKAFLISKDKVLFLGGLAKSISPVQFSNVETPEVLNLKSEKVERKKEINEEISNLSAGILLPDHKVLITLQNGRSLLYKPETDSHKILLGPYCEEPDKNYLSSWSIDYSATWLDEKNILFLGAVSTAPMTVTSCYPSVYNIENGVFFQIEKHRNSITRPAILDVNGNKYVFYNSFIYKLE